jgi:predicted nucleotide-binding protein
MTSSVVTELVEIAENCFNTLAEMRNDDRQRSLKAIERASAEIGAAWSGSNLGYHASVYTFDLRAKRGEFNPEWGLMERWPTHEPHQSWLVIDDNTVETEIIKRAGSPDLMALRGELPKLAKRLDAEREHALSALIAAKVKDDFVSRQLQQLKQIASKDLGSCIQSMLRVPTYSRDAQAVAQGAQPAVHQATLALAVVAFDIEDNFERLERICRDCARHLGRAPLEGIKSSSGATIFIGHGRDNQWLELQNLLEKKLGLRVIHFNHEAVAGISTKERLQQMVEAADIAFVVLTAEDELVDGTVSARDNVIHEVGLFQAALGFERTVAMLEDGCAEFSNIAGLGQIRFPKGRIRASFEDVREVLEREGIVKVV